MGSCGRQKESRKLRSAKREWEVAVSKERVGSCDQQKESRKSQLVRESKRQFLRIRVLGIFKRWLCFCLLFDVVVSPLAWGDSVYVFEGTGEA